MCLVSILGSFLWMELLDIRTCDTRQQDIDQGRYEAECLCSRARGLVYTDRYACRSVWQSDAVIPVTFMNSPTSRGCQHRSLSEESRSLILLIVWHTRWTIQIDKLSYLLADSYEQSSLSPSFLCVNCSSLPYRVFQVNLGYFKTERTDNKMVI